MVKCRICGNDHATIREEEISTARITWRAHVDCNGHSQYRNITWREMFDLRKDEEA